MFLMINSTPLMQEVCFNMVKLCMITIKRDKPFNRSSFNNPSSTIYKKAKRNTPIDRKKNTEENGCHKKPTTFLKIR